MDGLAAEERVLEGNEGYRERAKSCRQRPCRVQQREQFDLLNIDPSYHKSKSKGWLTSYQYLSPSGKESSCGITLRHEVEDKAFLWEFQPRERKRERVE